MKLAPTLAILFAGTAPFAQAPGEVVAGEKLVPGHLGFAGPLDPGDRFGAAVCVIGDVDGDGIPDLAVGAPGDDDAGAEEGAVWILFLDPTGDVRQTAKIAGPGRPEEGFGGSLAALGDLDGNGVPDLVVGGPDATGIYRPRYYVCLLAADGTLAGIHSTSRAQLGSLASILPSFGEGLAAADLDGDGRREVFVGNPRGINAEDTTDVFTVRHDVTGMALGHTITSQAPAGLLYALGHSLAAVGDRNGDGVPDLAVGDPLPFAYGIGGPTFSGRLWLFFLDPLGLPSSRLEIGTGKGGLSVRLNSDDKFGLAVTEIADLDGNGITDLAVGAGDDTSYAPLQNPGMVWLLFMEPGGMVGSEARVGHGVGGFTGPLRPLDRFGEALSWWPRPGAGGVGTLWVGAEGDDEAGTDAGAVWRVALAGVDDPPAVRIRNGTHENPLALTSQTLPRVDATWIAEVDATYFPLATTTYLLGYEDAAQVPLPFGELLVRIEALGGSSVFVDASSVVAGVGRHVLPIPDDLSFVGREVHVQGLFAEGTLLLTNALHLTIGGP